MPVAARKKPAWRGGTRRGTIIDVINEDILSMREAAAMSCFQTKGRPASTTTMFRHRANGLEAMWSTVGWKTSKQAIQRYFEKLNMVDMPLVTKRASKAQHEKATIELTKSRI